MIDTIRKQKGMIRLITKKTTGHDEFHNDKQSSNKKAIRNNQSNTKAMRNKFRLTLDDETYRWKLNSIVGF